jgi:hypothetical protein
MYSGGSTLDGSRLEQDGVVSFEDGKGGNPWSIYLDGGERFIRISSK